MLPMLDLPFGPPGFLSEVKSDAVPPNRLLLVLKSRIRDNVLDYVVRSVINSYDITVAYWLCEHRI